MALAHPAPDQASAPGKKLRVLDASEEYLWLSEPTKLTAARILAEVEGATTVQDWQRALELVQKRYPLLSARIRKLPGERPFFETAPDVPLPLRVLPYNHGFDLDQLIADESVLSFGYGDKSLARLTLCHGPDRSAILFSAHHSACDGRTNVMIVQDLIAAASGETLGAPLPLLATIGELAGLGKPEPYTKQLPVQTARQTSWPKLPPSTVRRWRMEASVVRTVLEAVKAEQTTLHAALIAAFTLAGKQRSPRLRTSPVMCLSPIDLRPILNLPGAAGNILSVHPTIVQPEDNLAFWDLARTAKAGLLQSQCIEAARVSINKRRSLCEQEGDPDDSATLERQTPFRHDLMITNYGDCKVRTQYGSLKLTALYPAVLTGDSETQTISAITVDGVLYLLQISQSPIPTLFEDMQEILSAACKSSLQPV